MRDDHIGDKDTDTVPNTDINVIVDRIEAWLQELESGRHKQGKGYLCDNGAYCCLGIAAEFVLKAVPFPEAGKIHFDYESNRMIHYLHPEATQALGLHDGSGDSSKGSGFSSLSNLNDDGRSFEALVAILRDDLATNKYGYFVPEVYTNWGARHA